MSEKIWTPRVTVAAVIEDQGRFLMVEEATEDGPVFNQPAGHLEDDETLLDAVVREVREETAWGFDPKGLTGTYRWRMADSGRTYLRFCFHGGCLDHDPHQSLDDGILGARWLTREQLIESDRLRSPMVLTCLNDYLSGRSFSLDLLQDVHEQR